MAKRASKEISPVTMKTGVMDVTILGITPFIYNAVSEKNKRSLLKPARRKTQAERAISLKHEPLKEYYNSTYRRKQNERGKTRLLIPCRMFKAAMIGSAKRIGGASGAELRQLAWVDGQYADMYGIPQIFMTVVKQNMVPDIRTRAIVPQWCCHLKINHVLPNLSSKAVLDILGTAGFLNGVGDFRQEKGADHYGQFRLANPNDPQVKALMKNGALKQQEAALKDPISYDQETEEMLEWFNNEMENEDWIDESEGEDGDQE